MEKREKIIERKEKVFTPNVQSEVKVEKVLIENFVSLQQVMTNLAVKFDNLSGQISKLLELFEISAKTLAEKGSMEEGKTDKKAAEKLDSLLEQNKIIAKGIALLHERNAPEPQYAINQVQRPAFYPPQQSPANSISRNPKFRKIT